MTLSLCMIVKNEEKFLPECLQSVRGIADEIIIVDTGSTDRTVAIAEEYGAQVRHFSWTGHFAEARNESIRDAKGDWILWLDADERLQPGSQQALKNLPGKPEHPVIYSVTIHNHMYQSDDIQVSGGHRLFTNHFGIRFDGRIHEQVVYSAKAAGAEEHKVPVILTHLGYGLEPHAQQEKNLRNRKLLEKQVGEEPANAYVHYTLAQHYAMTDEPDKALKHFRKALELNQFDDAMTASLLNTTAEALNKLKLFDEAGELIGRSIGIIPEQVGAYFMAYRKTQGQGQWSEALEWLSKLEYYNNLLRTQAGKISTDVLLSPEQVVFARGTVLEQLGRIAEAETLFSGLTRIIPAKVEVWLHLAENRLKQNKFSEAEPALVKMETLAEQQPNFYDVLATVQIRLQKFTEAIATTERKISKYQPTADDVKRLAGLYAKIGKTDIARELLSALGQN
jgi:glycosyltransferase involved in cell wall biosynthesis